jgi:hypothetical protein
MTMNPAARNSPVTGCLPVQTTCQASDMMRGRTLKELVMSTYCAPFNKIRARDLFDGRLAKLGVRQTHCFVRSLTIALSAP